MERKFTSYNDLPVGEEELKAAGWHKHGTTCNPSLGFAWTQDASGMNKEHPMKLYTTAGGQPAGVGIVILGHGQEPLPEEHKKWATESPLAPTTTEHAFANIDVAFRSGDIMCSGAKDTAAIGNTLILNPTGKNSKSLPLTESDADSSGWRRGSCFDGMGYHHFFDTAVGGGKLSWKAVNLLPVVTMFDKGELNAIFFVSTINQVSIPIFKSNQWEPKSLSSSEMCANLCDKDCAFPDLTSGGPFSTFHVYFRDHSKVTCPSNLKCMLSWPQQWSCCPSDVVV